MSTPSPTFTAHVPSSKPSPQQSPGKSPVTPQSSSSPPLILPPAAENPVPFSTLTGRLSTEVPNQPVQCPQLMTITDPSPQPSENTSSCSNTEQQKQHIEQQLEYEKVLDALDLLLFRKEDLGKVREKLKPLLEKLANDPKALLRPEYQKKLLRLWIKVNAGGEILNKSEWQKWVSDQNFSPLMTVLCRETENSEKTKINFNSFFKKIRPLYTEDLYDNLLKKIQAASHKSNYFSPWEKFVMIDWEIKTAQSYLTEDQTQALNEIFALSLNKRIISYLREGKDFSTHFYSNVFVGYDAFIICIKNEETQLLAIARFLLYLESEYACSQTEFVNQEIAELSTAIQMNQGLVKEKFYEFSAIRQKVNKCKEAVRAIEKKENSIDYFIQASEMIDKTKKEILGSAKPVPSLLLQDLHEEIQKSFERKLSKAELEDFFSLLRLIKVHPELRFKFELFGTEAIRERTEYSTASIFSVLNSYGTDKNICPLIQDNNVSLMKAYYRRRPAEAFPTPRLIRLLMRQAVGAEPLFLDTTKKWAEQALNSVGFKSAAYLIEYCECLPGIGLNQSAIFEKIKEELSHPVKYFDQILYVDIIKKHLEELRRKKLLTEADEATCIGLIKRCEEELEFYLECSYSRDQSIDEFDKKRWFKLVEKNIASQLSEEEPPKVYAAFLVLLIPVFREVERLHQKGAAHGALRSKSIGITDRDAIRLLPHKRSDELKLFSTTIIKEEDPISKDCRDLALFLVKLAVKIYGKHPVENKAFLNFYRVIGGLLKERESEETVVGLAASQLEEMQKAGQLPSKEEALNELRQCYLEPQPSAVSSEKREDPEPLAFLKRWVDAEIEEGLRVASTSTNLFDPDFRFKADVMGSDLDITFPIARNIFDDIFATVIHLVKTERFPGQVLRAEEKKLLEDYLKEKIQRWFENTLEGILKRAQRNKKDAYKLLQLLLYVAGDHQPLIVLSPESKRNVVNLWMEAYFDCLFNETRYADLVKSSDENTKNFVEVIARTSEGRVEPAERSEKFLEQLKPLYAEYLLKKYQSRIRHIVYQASLENLSETTKLLSKIKILFDHLNSIEPFFLGIQPQKFKELKEIIHTELTKVFTTLIRNYKKGILGFISDIAEKKSLHSYFQSNLSIQYLLIAVFAKEKLHKERTKNWYEFRQAEYQIEKILVLKDLESHLKHARKLNSAISWCGTKASFYRIDRPDQKFNTDFFFKAKKKIYKDLNSEDAADYSDEDRIFFEYEMFAQLQEIFDQYVAYATLSDILKVKEQIPQLTLHFNKVGVSLSEDYFEENDTLREVLAHTHRQEEEELQLGLPNIQRIRRMHFEAEGLKSEPLREVFFNSFREWLKYKIEGADLKGISKLINYCLILPRIYLNFELVEALLRRLEAYKCQSEDIPQLEEIRLHLEDLSNKLKELPEPQKAEECRELAQRCYRVSQFIFGEMMGAWRGGILDWQWLQYSCPGEIRGRGIPLTLLESFQLIFLTQKCEPEESFSVIKHLRDFPVSNTAQTRIQRWVELLNSPETEAESQALESLMPTEFHFKGKVLWMKEPWIVEEGFKEFLFSSSTFLTRDESLEVWGAFLSLMAPLCEGVALLHKEGFFHRNIKLEKILIKEGRLILIGSGFYVEKKEEKFRRELSVDESISQDCRDLVKLIQRAMITILKNNQTDKDPRIQFVKSLTGEVTVQTPN